MGDATMQAPAVAKPQGEALRWVSVGLTVAAVVVTAFMVSGIRPEGRLLDVSEASSSLLVPIALIVNVVSVARRHRTALDIGSLVVSGLLMAGMVVDAAIYTLTPPG